MLYDTNGRNSISISDPELIGYNARKDTGSRAFTQERQFPVCIHTRTLAHVELKCHYLAGMEELNNNEETGK